MKRTRNTVLSLGCLLANAYALRNGVRGGNNLNNNKKELPEESSIHRSLLQKEKLAAVESIIQDINDNETVRVFVGYNNHEGRDHAERLSVNETEIRDFDEVHAVAVEVEKQSLPKLAQDYNIDSIEQDELVTAAAVSSSSSTETVPYGIRMSEALKAKKNKNPGGSATLSSSTFGDCSDPNSFKIAIVDTGIELDHPDLPCVAGALNDKINCIGKSFGTDKHEVWYEDNFKHGTHVTGIISAIKNGHGVVGMLPDPENVCFIFPRVLGDDGNGYMSDILDGARWAVQQGAHVINMSLVGSFYNSIHEAMYNDFVKKNGTIIVASAGNEGTDAYGYPASYDNVVSVGAIDKNGEKAKFSQYNDQVNFAAPGKDVYSTVPGLYLLRIEGVRDVYNFNKTSNSPEIPVGGVSGKIIRCPDDGTTMKPCPGGGGHICLIVPSSSSGEEEMSTTTEEKALNCQASGGATAIIVHDGEEGISLSNTTNVTIPVLSIDKNSGDVIARDYQRQEAGIEYHGGYKEMSGTSMSAPHVTGAIASMWRACPKCNSKLVLRCLKKTAKKLGKSKEFGRGLIRAKKAYKCLKRQRCCK